VNRNYSVNFLRATNDIMTTTKDQKLLKNNLFKKMSDISSMNFTKFSSFFVTAQRKNIEINSAIYGGV